MRPHFFTGTRLLAGFSDKLLAGLDRPAVCGSGMGEIHIRAHGYPCQ